MVWYETSKRNFLPGWIYKLFIIHINLYCGITRVILNNILSGYESILDTSFWSFFKLSNFS